MALSLVGRSSYTISNGLKIHIPTIREVRGNNDKDIDTYYKVISPFIMTSTDCMVELFEQGIDFQNFEDDWIFFCMNMSAIQDPLDYSLIFENIGECKFEVVQDNQDNLYVFDKEKEILITKDIYYEISEVLCKTNFIEKKHRKFANQRALEKAVKMLKKKREKKNKTENQLDEMILFAVNNSNFKYHFDSINDLTIYTFYACLKQIQNNNHVDNLMLGGYTGNIDLQKLSPNELNRFIEI